MKHAFKVFTKLKLLVLEEKEYDDVFCTKCYAKSMTFNML